MALEPLHRPTDGNSTALPRASPFVPQRTGQRASWLHPVRCALLVHDHPQTIEDESIKQGDPFPQCGWKWQLHQLWGTCWHLRRAARTALPEPVGVLLLR
ncbi:hypothetical protein GCM10023317_82600 [Actinopolymorpha pittospori]